MKLTSLVAGFLMLANSAFSLGNEEIIIKDIMPSARGMDLYREINIKCSGSEKITLRYYTKKKKRETAIFISKSDKENPYLIIKGDKFYLDKNEDRVVDETAISSEIIPEMKACEYLR